MNKLWKVIKSEVDLEPVSSTSTAEQDDLQDEEADPLEALLKSKETTRRNTARRAANPIDAAIDSFLSEPRLDQRANILEYWHSRRITHPLLYALSKVALAVLATQVSVERLFSSLKFILSVQRSQLSEDLLNDILFLRANVFFHAFDE